MIEGLGFAMAAQFQRDGKGGWLYRKDQVGAPIPTTREERNRHVRRYGWITLAALPLFMGLVIGLSMIVAGLVPSPSDNVGAVGGIVLGGGSMLLTYLYLKWFSHAPAREFADRAPVGEARSRKQAFGRQVAQRSYWKMAGMTLFLMAGGVYALRDRPESWWLPIGLPLVIALALAWRKWSIEREPG